MIGEDVFKFRLGISVKYRKLVGKQTYHKRPLLLDAVVSLHRLVY